MDIKMIMAENFSRNIQTEHTTITCIMRIHKFVCMAICLLLVHTVVAGQISLKFVTYVDYGFKLHISYSNKKTQKVTLPVYNTKNSEAKQK